MAFATDTEWRVRSGGASSNGGGFDVGSAGTNYANQAAAQVTYTDLVIDAVTNTKITSAAFPFTSLHEGNIINVTGGTGFTIQRVQVVSVAAGVATCDKAVGTTGSTGGTGKLGGAFDHVSRIGTLPVGGNKIRVKKATYTTASTITYTTAGGDGTQIEWIGYDVTDADDGMPTLQASNGAASPVFVFSGNNNIFRNFIIDGNSLSNIGFQATGLNIYVQNIEATNCLASGIEMNSFGQVCCRSRCSSCGGTGADNSGFSGSTTGAEFIECEAVGCANGFAAFNSRPKFYRCISRGNNKSGFYSFGADGLSMEHCVSDGNTLDGLRLFSTSSMYALFLLNNVFSNNGGYGWKSATVDYSVRSGAKAAALLKWNNNAFYNNTSGERSQMPPGTNDITLTADPYTDQPAQDYTLNATVGGGAALSQASLEKIGLLATPLTGTSYLDSGPYQQNGVTSAPNAPSSLTATLVPTGVLLQWADNSTDEDFFLIERSVSGGGYAVLATVSANDTNETDTDVLPSTVYAYKVKAVNSAGSSAYSNIVTITTLPTATGTPTAPDIDEVRFPPDISRGAIGGEMFATIVVAGSTGVEQRNENWDVPRMVWEVSHGLRTPTEGRELKSFFLNRHGKSRGFRFKNWDDYTATDEVLYQTGAKTVQLAKTYSDGVFDFIKYIFKPTEDTTPFTMRRNGVNFTAFTLDETTGIVTLDADASFSISAITKAANAVITVTAHTFLTGETVYMEGVNGMTQINGQTVVIVSTGANTITVDLDTSAYSTYTSGGMAAEYVQPSEVLDWAGEFDIPARFDTDQIRLSLTDSFVREWNDITVLELIA